MIQLVHYWKCVNVREAREGEKESGQEERRQSNRIRENKFGKDEERKRRLKVRGVG